MSAIRQIEIRRGNFAVSPEQMNLSNRSCRGEPSNVQKLLAAVLLRE